MIKEFFSTIMYSWGSDTPPEVFWALNNLLSYAKFKGFESDLLFDNPMESDDSEISSNNNEILIENLVVFFDNLK